MIPLSGIILAGGESRRMGRPKPFLPYRGKPLIDWVFSAMEPLCDEIIIVANQGDFSHLAARVIPDNFPGQGPAAGIEAGLAAMHHPVALLASCDTPNLTPAFYQYLIDNHKDYEITIPIHDGFTEPLIGVYSSVVLDAFRTNLLAGNPHPPRIIRNCRWQALPVAPAMDFHSPDLFLNLNAPEDLF